MCRTRQCANGAPNAIYRRALASISVHQWLSERLGQQFFVDNRPGGRQYWREAVVRAPADGHTLLLASATNAINATLYDKLNFNFNATSHRSPS
jgi:tripartite-type tricarboxylate transporter receptor subunit TctC